MNRIARRQRAALALFIALTVSGVGVAMATPQAGDQPTVTLDVSPNDGQNLSTPASVTVTGAGFTPNSQVQLVQSADLPGGTSAISPELTPTFLADSSGNFQKTVNVSQTFVPDAGGTPIDCNAAGVTCYVEAFGPGSGNNSRHTISFVGGTTVPPTSTSTTVAPTTTSSTIAPTTTSSTIAPTTTSSTSTSTTVAPTTTSSTTSTTVAPTTTSSTSTSTTVAPTTTSSTTSTTVAPTTTSSTTSTTVAPTTTVVPTSTTVAPTTTTIGGGPTTTLGATQCAQIRAARAQLNAQIDAARNQILQSGLSPQQQAASLAQLEAIRAQGNAQLDALLAGCPTP